MSIGREPNKLIGAAAVAGGEPFPDFYGPLSALAAGGAREAALVALKQGGLCAIDDDGVQLNVLKVACQHKIGIASERVQVAKVDRGLDLDSLITATMGKLVESIESGRSFAVFATDYHLTKGFTGLDVVRALDAAFKETPFMAQWEKMGRVLVSGGADDRERLSIGQSGLFDMFLQKPYSLDELERVLVSSILLRGRLE